MARAGKRLIIVSNRLPVVIHRDNGGDWEIRPGAGGLVTAMAPVLRDRGGLWIGWPGTVAEDKVDVSPLLKSATRDSGYELSPVLLTEEQKLNYYRGFANEIIWPLFHDLQSRCRFEPAYYYTYRAVNHLFAEQIVRHAGPDDFVWIHDYHLMSVAMELRAMRRANRLAFFLHIPFPPLDIFLRLPWRYQILRDLLAHDLLGFQTQRDRRNFVQCVRALIKDVRVGSKGLRTTIHLEGRDIHAGVFPIGIDFDQFARGAASQEVSEEAWYVHEHEPERKIYLGVDRLDYTKGIPEKLLAFRSALRRFPQLHERIVLFQLVVPSRWEIPEYAGLKTEIEGLVGEINGEFSRAGWAPVQYFFRSLERRELLALYRTAEVLLTTPWKDGMNLVAKEYCACNVDESGVVILSEFAGALAQMHRNSLQVNPHDIEGMAEAIFQAYSMPLEERRDRMHRLRQSIRRQDVFWWVDSFLQAAIERRLDSFPHVEEYVPRPDLP
jgi:trehalose 6-phosphate synthase/phosphatase